MSQKKIGLPNEKRGQSSRNRDGVNDGDIVRGRSP